jgi:hypothetical protein
MMLRLAKHAVLGTGEFTLPFRNFDVNITVPADHVMEATEAMNRSEVFTEQVKDTNWLKNHLISLL